MITYLILPLRTSSSNSESLCMYLWIALETTNEIGPWVPLPVKSDEAGVPLSEAYAGAAVVDRHPCGSRRGGL